MKMIAVVSLSKDEQEGMKDLLPLGEGTVYMNINDEVVEVGTTDLVDEKKLSQAEMLYLIDGFGILVHSLMLRGATDLRFLR